MLYKKKRFKPLYKKFIRLRQNVQNRKKLYNFKKNKWQKLLKYLRKLKKNKRKVRIYDHTIYYKPKFGFYFKNKFKFDLHTKQRLQLFYGGLTNKYLKFIVKNSYVKIKNKRLSKFFVNTNSYFIEALESRIDAVLYRAHFVSSMRNARQLISHGQVFVNSIKIKNSSYMLKKGDLIAINPKSYNIIKNSICISNKWPIPPNYMQINYKIFQILLLTDIKYTRIIYHFPFWLNLSSLVKYYAH